MTYKLACALPKPLTAIAVVSGNMSQVLENTCVVANGLPVMHFHGTADPIVSYNGTVGIPPVDTTIHWWVNKNNCNPTPAFTTIPNTHTDDSSTVEKYYYSGGKNGSEVTFYKIINGGHTWPGSIPVPPLGNTNEDINASALMGSFFRSFCPSSVGIKEATERNPSSIFPNPVDELLTIEFPARHYDFSVYDGLGQLILTKADNTHRAQFNCSVLAKGIYLIKIKSGSKIFTTRFIKS